MPMIDVVINDINRFNDFDIDTVNLHFHCTTPKKEKNMYSRSWAVANNSKYLVVTSPLSVFKQNNYKDFSFCLRFPSLSNEPFDPAAEVCRTKLLEIEQRLHQYARQSMNSTSATPMFKAHKDDPSAGHLIRVGVTKWDKVKVFDPQGNLIHEDNNANNQVRTHELLPDGQMIRAMLKCGGVQVNDSDKASSVCWDLYAFQICDTPLQVNGPPPVADTDDEEEDIVLDSSSYATPVRCAVAKPWISPTTTASSLSSEFTSSSSSSSSSVKRKRDVEPDMKNDKQCIHTVVNKEEYYEMVESAVSLRQCIEFTVNNKNYLYYK